MIEPALLPSSTTGLPDISEWVSMPLLTWVPDVVEYRAIVDQCRKIRGG